MVDEAWYVNQAMVFKLLNYPTGKSEVFLFQQDLLFDECKKLLILFLRTYSDLYKMQTLFCSIVILL